MSYTYLDRMSHIYLVVLFPSIVTLDRYYQDANELWTNYGLDYCFHNFDLVATDT